MMGGYTSEKSPSVILDRRIGDLREATELAAAGHPLWHGELGPRPSAKQRIVFLAVKYQLKKNYSENVAMKNDEEVPQNFIERGYEAAQKVLLKIKRLSIKTPKRLSKKKRSSRKILRNSQPFKIKPIAI